MLHAKYRFSDGQFLCVWSQRPDFDPATEAVQEYQEHLRPNLRTDRYDAASPTKKRAASEWEIVLFDAARADAEADARVTTDKRFLVLAEFVRREINVIRAVLPTPLPPITRVDALDALRTIYKTM